MFIGALYLRADGAPDTWVLTRSLAWDDWETGRIVVPEGFKTDLASIPAPLRGLPHLDVNGISRRAAVLHDFLYSTRAPKWVTKPIADFMFRKALRQDGASAFTAWMFYQAVHVFGARAWINDHAPTLQPKP